MRRKIRAVFDAIAEELTLTAAGVGVESTEETALEKLAPTECPDCDEAVESLG